MLCLAKLVRLPRSTSSRNRTPRCDFRDDARQSVTGRLIDFRDHEQDHQSDGGRLPQQPRAGPGRLTSGPIPSPDSFPQLSTVQDRLVAAITGISARPVQGVTFRAIWRGIFSGKWRTAFVVADRWRRAGGPLTGVSLGDRCQTRPSTTTWRSIDNIVTIRLVWSLNSGDAHDEPSFQ